MKTKSKLYKNKATRIKPVGFLPNFAGFVLRSQEPGARSQEPGAKQTSTSSAPLKLKLTSHLTNRFN